MHEVLVVLVCTFDSENCFKLLYILTYWSWKWFTLFTVLMYCEYTSYRLNFMSSLSHLCWFNTVSCECYGH